MTKKKGARHEPGVKAKRLHRVADAAEPRSEGLFTTLEKQAEERFERLFVRLIWRLGLVSQKDVRNLSQRIDQLERRVRRPTRLKVVPRKPPEPSKSGSSGNSAA